MTKRDSNEPKKRVSWGPTHVKHIAIDESAASNTVTLDENSLNDTISPYVMVDNFMVRDYDHDIFERNLADIETEAKNTTMPFQDLVEYFNKRNTEEINIDLINTIDVRKMIGDDLKEEENVDFEMEIARHGIRFYDNFETKNKRMTVNVFEKEMEPSMFLFYENYLKEELEYYNKFTMDLLEMIDKYREKPKLDVNSFKEKATVSNLKKLKQVCRIKATIDWYQLRRAKEAEFTSLVANNRNKMNEKWAELHENNRRVTDQMNYLEEEVKTYSEIIKKLRINMSGEIKNSKSDLLRMITEQNQVIGSCKKELGEMCKIENELNIENMILEKEKNTLKEEINDLEKIVVERGRGEEDYKKSKRELENLQSVFKTKIIKLCSNFMKIQIGSFIISFYFNDMVIDFTYEITDKSNYEIYDFFISKFDYQNKTLRMCVSEIQAICFYVGTFFKELVEIKSKYDVKIELKEGKMFVQIDQSFLYEFTDIFNCKVTKNGEEVEMPENGWFGEIIKNKDPKMCLVVK